MIMDTYTQFANAQSVAAAAGTALIGDVIDMSEARDIGNSGPLWLVITTTTAIITGGSAGTILFQLASDAQAAIATDGSATVHYQTEAYVTDDAALNDLNIGTNIARVMIPMENPVYERFLGILAVVGTTTVTAGAITAFLTLDPANWKSLPDGAN